MTLRDSVWNSALEQIERSGRFRMSDLPFNKNELASCRRVLREMEEYDWLQRTSTGSCIWRAGPKAEMLMNLSEEKLKLARE